MLGGGCLDGSFKTLIEIKQELGLEENWVGWARFYFNEVVVCRLLEISLGKHMYSTGSISRILIIYQICRLYISSHYLDIASVRSFYWFAS